MSFDDRQQECMGWCPCEQQMTRRCQSWPGPEMGDAAGGGNATTPAEFPWWQRYHNQLLVAALLASGIAVLLVSLTGSTSGSFVTAAAIAAGATIGLSVNHSKRYGEIAAGKWRRGAVPAKKRLIAGAVLFVLIVITIICLAWFVSDGQYDSLGMIALGAALIYWSSLAITLRWERRHNEILIKEWGSWYSVNRALDNE